MANFSSVRHGRGRGHRRGESRRSGQWKLAYADFLTALMAFFLLMWLSTGTSMAERSAIAAYFGGTDEDAATPIPTDASEALKRLLSQSVAQSPLNGLQAHIGFDATPEGLRINLTDTPGRSLFETGNSQLNEDGLNLTRTLGQLIADMPHPLRIEGHTDAFKTAPGSATNWAISSARANAALDTLLDAGVSPDRFTTVSGLADTMPLLPTRPHAPVNRRISIVLELPH